jgi:hypothetical protein
MTTADCVVEGVPCTVRGEDCESFYVNKNIDPARWNALSNFLGQCVMSFVGSCTLCGSERRAACIGGICQPG